MNIKNDGDRKAGSPESVDPRRGVDAGSKQSVFGESTRECKEVWDKQQSTEDKATRKNDKGLRPEHGRLGKKLSCNNQLAGKHDCVDHRYKRFDVAQSNVVDGQDQWEGHEQHADD